MPPVVRRGVGCSSRGSGAGVSPWPRHHARPGERSRRKTRGTKLVLREACAWPHGSGRRHGFRRSAERKAPVRERGDGGGTGEAADEGGRSPRRAGAAEVPGDGRLTERRRRDEETGLPRGWPKPRKPAATAPEGAPRLALGPMEGRRKRAEARRQPLSCGDSPPPPTRCADPWKGVWGAAPPKPRSEATATRGGASWPSPPAIRGRGQRSEPETCPSPPAILRAWPPRAAAPAAAQKRSGQPRYPAPVQAAGARRRPPAALLAGNAGVCEKTEPVVCRAAGGAFPARYPAGVRRRWIGLGALSDCLDLKLPLGSAVAEP